MELITTKTEIPEEETKPRLCKLCFTYTSYKEDFKEIDDIVKENLELLSLYINLDETQENLICNTCTSRLIELSNFKSSCLDVESIIVPNVTSSAEKFVDLTTIYLNQKRGDLTDLRDGEICRLCLNVTRVFNLCHDSLYKYIPEVDFTATENPVVCKKCHTLLYDLSCFVENVQSKMIFNGPKTEYIENYVSNSQVNDNIKKEEIGQECGEFSCENNLSLNDVGPPDEPTASCKIEIKEENLRVPSSEEILEKTDASKKKEDDKKHKCSLCNFKTNQKRYLISHVSLTHAGETHQKLHKCEMCDYVTNKLYNLKMHSRSHLERTKRTPIKCRSCDFQAYTRHEIYRHQTASHKTAEETKKYKCKICDFSGPWKSSLERHVQKHSSPRELKNFPCYKCDFTSSCRSSLIAHESEHKKPSDPYKCEVCPYETMYRKNFKDHRQMHLKRVEEKPLECEFCPYKTESKRCFRMHVSSHVDLYECHTCGKKSRSRKQFCSHVARHRDPLRMELFKCHLCEFETGHKPSLKRHLRTHQLNCGEAAAKDGTASSDVLNVVKKNKVKAILQQLIK